MACDGVDPRPLPKQQSLEIDNIALFLDQQQQQLSKSNPSARFCAGDIMPSVSSCLRGCPVFADRVSSFCG